VLKFIRHFKVLIYIRFVQTFVEAFDLKSAKNSAIFAIGLKDSTIQVHDFN